MRYNDSKKASIFGIIGNIFLSLIKGICAFLFNSQAMKADFFNSAGDVFSSIMTFIGNRVASKPSDKDHDLGHGKAEYIYSFIISIAMIIASYEVFKSSILALINKNIYKFSIWLVIVYLVTIVVKFILFTYTKYLYKKNNNLLLKANCIDHRNDFILTSLNLAACLFSLKNIYFLDGVMGMAISIWIFISAIKIFMESYDVLMDKSIDEATKNKVYDIIFRHEEIKLVNHFNATPVGYKYQISFTIFVDGNLSTFASHEIANNLEKEIDKKIDEIYLTVIHVNPIDN